MNRGAWAIVAAVVPGGAIMAAAGWFAALYRAARTGIAALDRWSIRGNAVLALVATFGLRVTPAVARAYVAGVLANENAFREGDPQYGDAHFPRGRVGYYPVGDVAVARGPSVGPGQVLSGLHLARLGYQGDPLDLARVGNERAALYYSARIFREAYDAAGGDLADAIRRYNGAGPQAEKYRETALARIASLGGLA